MHSWAHWLFFTSCSWKPPASLLSPHSPLTPSLCPTRLLPFHQPLGLPECRGQGNHPISHTLGTIWVTILRKAYLIEGVGGGRTREDYRKRLRAQKGEELPYGRKEAWLKRLAVLQSKRLGWGRCIRKICYTQRASWSEQKISKREKKEEFPLSICIEFKPN